MGTSLLLAVLVAGGPSTLDVKPLAGQPNLLALGVPEIPAALAARLEPYRNARSAALFDVAPDGDEGHGFQKKENRDTMTAAIALFLERQLLGDGAAGGSP